MKFYYVFLCFFLILCIDYNHLSFAQAYQRIEIPSSPNPIGSGARALGMGGAFIAIADDATAASWNPGGLVQLEKPELSLVHAYFNRTEDNDFGAYPHASGAQHISENSINHLSASYPFALFGRRMIISPQYQCLYDFTREASFPLELHSGTTSISQNFQGRMEGSLSAIGIGYCLQITPRFSFGLTLNIWDNGIYKNEWEQRAHQWGSVTMDTGDASEDTSFDFDYSSRNRYAFKGLNTNLGILWDLNNALTIGAVIKTSFSADLTHEFRSTSSYIYPDEPPVTYPDDYTQNEDLDMPMSYGIGLACRFSDNFTAALDIYRTEWDDFILKDPNGSKTSPISMMAPADSDIDPTTQVRIGIEYLIIGQRYVIPVRGGIFYDPAPAVGDPDDYYGFSLGSGIAVDRFSFDIAYQYRYGNNVCEYMLEALDFSQDLHEHTVYSSMIIHF
ncbi:MAG: OmpP1/FadL family transporter [bacterium]